MSSPKFIFSGGGTGGHIFPAIAIANAIKLRSPNADILFVGAKGRMEMERVPAAGYPIEGLWISGVQRKLTLKNALFPFKLISSLLRARSIVKSFKPDVVVGTGGFASGPLLRVAAFMHVPALIQEQNSFPGITNRLLASKVNRICVAYDGMEKYFPKEKLMLTGNPVRKEMVRLQGKKPKAIAHFELDPAKLTLLIIGGSLGAMSVNRAIEAKLEALVNEGVQLIWQTGKLGYANAVKAAKPYPDQGVHVFEFITDMDLAYAAADVVVSRAGAIAVSELCLVRKPAILVPYPHAAEDHQTRNAEALVNRNAAIMIADSEVNNDLVSAVIDLAKDESKREQLSEQISQMALHDAAERIADELINMIPKG